MDFTSEINIISEDGFDIIFNCPKPGIFLLKKYLINEGFTISDEYTSIEATKNISELIELKFNECEFNSLRKAIIKFLESKNVKYEEDKFYTSRDFHSRFNLKEISIFDKIK
ncbi:hypothetical protein ACOL3F_05500 [Aliarcobacter butzleri]